MAGRRLKSPLTVKPSFPLPQLDRLLFLLPSTILLVASVHATHTPMMDSTTARLRSLHPASLAGPEAAGYLQLKPHSTFPLPQLDRLLFYYYSEILFFLLSTILLAASQWWTRQQRAEEALILPFSPAQKH